MSFARRFTARNALIVLFIWLFLALFLHLKTELFDSADGQYATGAKSEHNDGLDHDNEKPKFTGNTKGGHEKGNGKKRKTAVVVASMRAENSSWMDEYFPQWEKNVYMVDDQTAPLTVPKNKGRESMVYLTYIIDNYDKLADNVLFIHPNRYQWHNDDPDYDGLPMLRHFQIPYLEKEGYVNIRCAWSLGCPAEIKPLEEEGEHRAAVHAGGDYKRAFQTLFPGKEVPKYVGVSCCAQFAATKEQIKTRKKEEYIKWREWLLATELDDSISGRVFEYSWHMIFGREAVHCPTAQDCYCKVFGLCDMKCSEQGSCPGRYTLPPYSTLPDGWPFVGWNKEERSRSAPEE